MIPDKDKTQKLCLRQQTQICGVNILFGRITKSLFERLDGTYHEENGYFIPDLRLPVEE